MITGGDDKFKSDVFEVLVPEVVSECSLVRDGTRKGTCLSDRAVDYLSKKAGVHALGLSDEETMKAIHERYGTKSDRALLTVLPEDMAKNEGVNLKITGPNGTDLLSNDDIDGILKQWEKAFDGFFAYNFNMLDYTHYSFRNGRVVNEPDTLATVNPAELFRKYNCAACIINSDVYNGHGKHWMAIFVDNRGREPSAEFFNSSGRGPVPEWISYLDRAARGVDTVNAGSKPPCRIVHNNLVQQYSMTECGLYSLFYVWSRLNGLPYGYFDRHQVFDQLMFEFRAHLFEGYGVRDDGTWSYADFERAVKVRWDSSGGHREGEK